MYTLRDEQKWTYIMWLTCTSHIHSSLQPKLKHIIIHQRRCLLVDLWRFWFWCMVVRWIWCADRLKPNKRSDKATLSIRGQKPMHTVRKTAKRKNKRKQTPWLLYVDSGSTHESMGWNYWTHRRGRLRCGGRSARSYRVRGFVRCRRVRLLDGKCTTLIVASIYPSRGHCSHI